jgi:uncharacterized protein YcfJ
MNKENIVKTKFSLIVIAALSLATLCTASRAQTQLSQQYGQPREVARVISATPVTQQFTTPQQYCHNETIQVQGQKSGAGALMGAIAGGAIGNNVGGGDGRTAATLLGLVGGAMVGNNIEGESAPVTKNVPRCQTENVIESRVVGFNVVYEYAGIQYRTQMQRDPGTQFAVRVSPLVN